MRPESIGKQRMTSKTHNKVLQSTTLLWSASLFLIVLSACQMNKPRTPIETVDYVDLNRFSGDWYVIASIPTFIEKDAYNAIEHYAAPNDGRVQTTFTFSKGRLDGARKVYRPTGFIRDDGSNAVWGMQFMWPFKAEYRVIHLDDDYQETIIGRSKRDYVWIMARSAKLADTDYERLVAHVAEAGYDTSKLRRVPHD
jgi:apolipoprotein D and lipocalin family protein